MQSALMPIPCLVMPKPAEVKRAVNFRIPEAILVRLEAYLSRQPVEVLPSAVMTAALREWLDRNDVPPPAKPPRRR